MAQSTVGTGLAPETIVVGGTAIGCAQQMPRLARSSSAAEGACRPSSTSSEQSELVFALPPGLESESESVPKFGPRVGRLALLRGRDRDRDDASTSTSTSASGAWMDTPNVFVSTSRGVVPHLSRDHVSGSDAIRWINVPFESFLEQVPPIPTLQGGPHPLHEFLGFDEDRHIVSLCLRDPLDTREMPPNGNAYVSANCVRGVKKVTLSDWREHVRKTQPDVVFALSDTPFAPPPHSQKRIAKSVERSTAWVADILGPLRGSWAESESRAPRRPLNVFVHMAGGTSIPAREAFAYGLGETLHGPDADAVKPLRCLDEGISGYAFDLAVLRGVEPSPSPSSSERQGLPDGARGENLTTSSISSVESSIAPNTSIASLLKASLGGLSERKPRLVTGTRSPHEMLRLIQDVGIDLFDVAWAMDAANLGVALDFCFPAPATSDGADARGRSLGHNLYEDVYARQFGRLADAYVGAGEGGAQRDAGGRQICPCIACSPRSPTSRVLHSTVDQQSYGDATNAEGEATVRYEKPYTRAYLHHLLRTHEMSAHTLLVAHNLAIVSMFLAGVRRVWVESGDEGKRARFALEVERFNGAYDESGGLFAAAKKDWESVDRARGKGRLNRESETQVNGKGGHNDEGSDGSRYR